MGSRVVESAYAVDEVLLNLPYVAVTVSWAARDLQNEPENEKQRISIPGNNKNRVDVCATYI